MSCGDGERKILGIVSSQSEQNCLIISYLIVSAQLFGVSQVL